MTITSMVGILWQRLNDVSGRQFTSSLLVDALNVAQTDVAMALHPVYLGELQYTDTSKVATSGIYAVTSLTQQTVLGGQAGVLQVIDTNTQLELTHVDAQEIGAYHNNYYLAGQTWDPRWYVKSGSIYLLPQATRTIDIVYLTAPITMVYSPPTSCELNADLHNIVLLLAEAQCLREDGKHPEAANAAELAAKNRIDALNAPYRPKE